MATSVVNPRAQFFANNGRPLIGGRIHTYVAGSSTRAPTYKDAARAQPNTNPIILDGRGEAQIYLAEGVEYKFVVEDSKGALIYTQDPVYGAIWPDNGKSLRIDLSDPDKGAELVAFKLSATGAAARTLAERGSDWVSLNDFENVKGDGINDDTAGIKNAIAFGKSVYFPEPSVFYNISDEIGPKFPGQVLFSHCRRRGFIRNVTNSNRLAIIGDPARADGAAPQAGLHGMYFWGNAETIGGIALATNLTLGNADWTDASKDCSLINCGVDFVGAGWALEVYSWENRIIGFTSYEGNLRGAIYADSANQNNTINLYITGCAQQSLQIGGDATGRRNRANCFNGVTVQQSGGAEGCIVIADADNTVINALYSESNNSKGAPRVVLVKDTARATQFNGISHLSGGAIVLRNEGLATVVNGVSSSNITGAIVDNRGSGSVVASSIEWMPGVTPSGVKFADNSANKTGKYFDGAGSGDWSINSFAPILQFNDISAGVFKTRFRYDQGVFLLEYDGANDGTFSTLLWAFNAAVPEFITDSLFRPNTDNARTLGTSARRWSVVYAGTGTINTSDGREKTPPEPITDTVLDAWEDVQFIAFQWLDMVHQKGIDLARWHFGVIAQQVRDAFAAHGLDGTRYGLLCYDEWDEVLEPVLGTRLNELTGQQEAFETGETRVVMAAGNRWGIRPDQCLFLEAAYQRRLGSRLGARLKRLEDLVGLDPLPQ